MQAKFKALTEDTLLPFGLVLILFGGVSWLTSLYDETKANGSSIEELRIEQKVHNEKLDRIILKISHVEGKLGMDPR
jgi:hypothetical protein